MIEIERKFLLKAMPDMIPTDIIKIDQFYFKNSKGVWERVRQYDSNLTGLKWIHTIKNRINDCTNEEIEKEISKKEYDKLYREENRERYIEYYKENKDELLAKKRESNKLLSQKYRDSYKLLKEICEHNMIQTHPEYFLIKDKINNILY